MTAQPPVTRRGTGPDGEAVFALAVEAALPAFQGHFPGDPLLPGVIQVDWAIRLGQEAYGDLGAFRGLEQVKFLRPVRPGTGLELRLALEPGAGGRRLRFQYLDPAGRVSSGTVQFQNQS
jgi:3-hydroxymyristoyl/3-hydroxydecanoyl-(acyl carrier protein) dehydratase